jgi:hypothetical protein
MNQPEQIEHFYDRLWVNFVDDYCYVYPVVRGTGVPEKWTLGKMRNYIKYLEDNQPE